MRFLILWLITLSLIGCGPKIHINFRRRVPHQFDVMPDSGHPSFGPDITRHKEI